MKLRKIALAVVMALLCGGAALAAPGSPKNSGSDNNTGGLADILGNALQSVLSTDKLTVDDLNGSWKYADPAISFKSDNFLQKAGGVAAAAAAKEKMAPYYKRLGFDKMTLSVNSADGTFTMAVGRMKLSGTIAAKEPTEDNKANFTMTFGLGGITIGNMDTYIVRSSKSHVEMMYDVSKLIMIVKAVGSITGNSTVQALTKLLESYDGICAGFALDKTE